MSVVDSNICSIFVVYFGQFEIGNNSKIRQVHTLLPLLTDNVQKNVEVRKQLSFGRMGHVYSRRQNTQSSLETIETSGKEFRRIEG